MVMFMICFRRDVFTLQEFSDSFLFLQFGRTLRIHPFHFDQFIVSHLRQMTDKVYEVPAFHRLLITSLLPKCRHTRESHAVFDEVIELAVRQFLCSWLSHVGRFWIQAPAQKRGSMPIVAVAG